MLRVSPTVSSLTTESIRRSMIPLASGRPQSMGLMTVDKSSDFMWPPVATRMDSSDLGDGDTPRANGEQRKACPVPTSRTGQAFRCSPFALGVSPSPRSDESIRVATGGHIKSDDLSTVINPIDCGRPDAIGIIDRRILSVVKDETVGETRSIYILPNHLIVIVQAECLRERCRRKIESPEFSLGDQKTVVLPGAIDIETGDRPFVVDACGLGAACGRWDGDHREHATLVVENVGVIDACGIGVIAGGLLKIIQAEKLVELCAREIHGRESAVDIEEAVVDSGGIDIEPIGIAPVVDSNHLCLSGIGKILQSEIVPGREYETYIGCGAMIAGNHFLIVDAEQLGERIVREIDCSEVKTFTFFPT